MHFADFSTLLLLASTVAATPRHHRKGHSAGHPTHGFSSAAANAVSSTPAAGASNSAPTTPVSSSSSGGVSYSATFTEYVLIDFSTCLFHYFHLCHSGTPTFPIIPLIDLSANVNFDLCKNDGAANALFGSSGIGMAFGKATQVSCDLWTGSQNYTTGTMPRYAS